MILFLKTYIIYLSIYKLNHMVATTWQLAQLAQLAPCSFSPSSCCCAAALWSSEICCSCWALAASNSTHWAPGRWIQLTACCGMLWMLCGWRKHLNLRDYLRLFAIIWWIPGHFAGLRCNERLEYPSFHPLLFHANGQNIMWMQALILWLSRISQKSLSC